MKNSLSPPVPAGGRAGYVACVQLLASGEAPSTPASAKEGIALNPGAGPREDDLAPPASRPFPSRQNPSTQLNALPRTRHLLSSVQRKKCDSLSPLVTRPLQP